MMSTTEGELDIEVAQEREEGELEDSDVEEGTYIPLARPETFNPPSLVHMQIQDEPSDEGSLEESSASESDDERRHRPKKSKLRSRPKQTQPVKNNKYNIWCTTLQEDLLTEDMVGCDVVTKKTRYGVESYDYTIKYRLEEDYKGKNAFANATVAANKRKHSDRNDVKLRLGTRMNNHRKSEERQQPRVIEDLLVTSNDTVEDVAKDIAEKLHEEKIDLIERIVRLLGTSKAIDIYKQTQTLEADGGVLVMNGIRRRTSGGVYFYLLKRDDEVSQGIVNQIFMEDRKETQRRIKQARAKSRQKVVEQLKQSLTDSELPLLLSRGEATLAGSEHGSNPPPSPATDARDCSSDTDAHAASPPRPASPPLPRHAPARAPLADPDDDDYLEVMCNDDMDLF